MSEAPVLAARAGADRARLRPTWNAARLGVALLAMALAAVNYQSNVAWMLTLLLASAAVVAIFHARRNLSGVTGAAGPAPTAFAGDPIDLPVILRNSAAVPAVAVWAGSHAAGTKPGNAQTIAPGGSMATTVTLPARPRGLFPVPAIHAVSSFPLGVSEALVPLPAVGEGIVYPRPAGRHLADVIDGSDPGEAQSEQAGDDFAGHRRPQGGDLPRHMDWKAVARGRPLLVKVFAGGTCQCILDWERTEGDGEARLSELTRWVLDAEALGWRYGLQLPGISIDLDSGITHRDRCLRELALAVVA